MKKGSKPHKHHSREKIAFIQKSGGMSYEQWAAQQSNIKNHDDKKDKLRQKKGKL